MKNLALGRISIIIIIVSLILIYVYSNAIKSNYSSSISSFSHEISNFIFCIKKYKRVKTTWQVNLTFFIYLHNFSKPYSILLKE